MKRIAFCTLVLISTSLFATIPTGYYDATNGLNQGALKTALYNIIKNPQVVGYDHLWQYYPQTDMRPDGTVWDMYSNHVYQFPDDGSSIIGMDREHAFPKSWWKAEFAADYFDCYSDLFNLNPADRSANQSIKSNYTIGEVDVEVTMDNGVSRKGKSTLLGRYAPKDYIMVWEPADEYKGDFARTYMYVVTCYQFISTATKSKGPAWSESAYHQITWNSSNTYPLLTDYSIELLLKWHKQDPVSTKELNRNEAVYAIQGNRNPFIDCPDFADYIWGDRKSQKFDTKLVSGQAFLTTPVANEVCTFKSDSIGTTRSLKLQVRANNITKPLSWSVKNKTKGTFTLPSKTISVSNATKGTVQTITYTCNQFAHDTAQIVIESDELLEPLTFYLAAETYDKFQVLKPDIKDEQFTIRWNPSTTSSEYKVSVYQLRDTGEVVWSALLNDDFNWSGKLPAGWEQSINEKGNAAGVNYDQQTYLRLGTGSMDGYVITPSYTIVDTVVVTSHASTYNFKDETGYKLSIYMNDKLVKNHDLTEDVQIFIDTIVVKGEQKARFKFLGYTNKQAWLDYVNISTYTHVESQLMIRPEFPSITANNSYLVDKVTNGEHYWYTIQPQKGENTSIYGPFEAVPGAVGVNMVENSNIICKLTGNLLEIDELNNDNVMVFDALGRLVYSQKQASDSLQITLPTQGMYLLKIGKSSPIKILYIK